MSAHRKSLTIMIKSMGEKEWNHAIRLTRNVEEGRHNNNVDRTMQKKNKIRITQQPIP